MTRLGRQIRSTVSKSNILQSLNYRGGFAPPTSRCRDLFIYQYSRDEELVAITLNQNVKSCGRTLYRTGIPGVHVMLLEDTESFFKQ